MDAVTTCTFKPKAGDQEKITEEKVPRALVYFAMLIRQKHPQVQGKDLTYFLDGLWIRRPQVDTIVPTGANLWVQE